MSPEALVAQYPRIWHMASDGSWQSIQEHGLLSTSALLDLYGYKDEQRLAIEARRRPQSVPITATGLPGATIRDQKPMTDSALDKCLPAGVTPENWYRLLNSKTFFWLSQPRLQRLLGARAYRDHAQIVLTLDTASLVEKHTPNILLCSTAARRSGTQRSVVRIPSRVSRTIPSRHGRNGVLVATPWSNSWSRAACLTSPSTSSRSTRCLRRRQPNSGAVQGRQLRKALSPSLNQRRCEPVVQPCGQRPQYGSSGRHCQREPGPWTWEERVTDYAASQGRP